MLGYTCVIYSISVFTLFLIDLDLSIPIMTTHIPLSVRHPLAGDMSATYEWSATRLRIVAAAACRDDEARKQRLQAMWW